MRECKYCGKKTTNPKFCNRSCSAKYQAKNVVPRPKTRKHYYCTECGIEVNYKNKWCSLHNPKRVDWSTVTLKDLKDKRSYQAHSQIRDNARRVYAKSDGPEHCLECGYDKHFDVCHIIDISDHPDETTVSEINSISNLIPLCKNHHWEFDNGLLKLNDIQKPISNFLKRGCIDCKKSINTASTRCKKCEGSNRMLLNASSNGWPDIRSLVLETCASSYSAIGRKYSKSANAVKKHITLRIDYLKEKASARI